MITSKNNKDFAAHLAYDNMLEYAIEWISNSLKPEDVFSVEQLEEWARVEGGFINDSDIIICDSQEDTPQ